MASAIFHDFVQNFHMPSLVVAQNKKQEALLSVPCTTTRVGQKVPRTYCFLNTIVLFKFVK